jgi:hypothetical protein
MEPDDNKICDKIIAEILKLFNERCSIELEFGLSKMNNIYYLRSAWYSKMLDFTKNYFAVQFVFDAISLEYLDENGGRIDETMLELSSENFFEKAINFMFKHMQSSSATEGTIIPTSPNNIRIQPISEKPGDRKIDI